MENSGAILRFWARGTHERSHFVETTYRSAKRWATKTISLSFFTILYAGCFIYWLHIVSLSKSSSLAVFMFIILIVCDEILL